MRGTRKASLLLGVHYFDSSCSGVEYSGMAGDTPEGRAAILQYACPMGNSTSARCQISCACAVSDCSQQAAMQCPRGYILLHPAGLKCRIGEALFEYRVEVSRRFTPLFSCGVGGESGQGSYASSCSQGSLVGHF